MPNYEESAERFVEAGREFYCRGWVLGTSGNFSSIISRRPSAGRIRRDSRSFCLRLWAGVGNKVMADEAWLNGKLEGYAPLLMPAAHALAQAIVDLQKHAPGLNDEELRARPSDAPSAAFHLRHIAGSINRLLTYSRGEQLSEAQFAALTAETADDADSNAVELTRRAVAEMNDALEVLKNVDLNVLFDERFVGRRRLPTNVFGLLFHIAEHTARHVGQVVTTAAVVRQRKN